MPSEEKKATRGAPFRKGKSGNPRGRPKGSKNKSAPVCPEIAELFDMSSKSIVLQLLKRAQAGEKWAILAALSRIAPPVKEERFSLDLPPVQDLQSAMEAHSRIIEAVSRGEISLAQAEGLSKVVQGAVRTHETSELEDRLEMIEAAIAKQKGKRHGL